MYKVECVDISEMSDAELEILWNSSDSPRAERAKRFYHREDQIRCLAAGALLRRLLWLHGIQSEEMPVRKNKYGKPYFKDRKLPYFNLSHAGNWVVFAWGESEVGIDIEKVTPADDGVAKYCFSEKEYRFVNEVSGVERDRRFTQIWTLKESYVKYLGVGLSDDLKSISIVPDKRYITYLKRNGSRTKLFFSSSLFHSDTFLSVCGEEEGIEVRELAVKDLLPAQF